MKRIVLGLALALLPLCASAGPQTDAKAATEPVVLQLEAFRRDDYDTAFTFASAEIQTQFDRESFEVMVRRGYPEIARSTFAMFVKTELAPDGAGTVLVVDHSRLDARVCMGYLSFWAPRLDSFGEAVGGERR